jgi:hypothetical protein
VTGARILSPGGERRCSLASNFINPTGLRNTALYLYPDGQNDRGQAIPLETPLNGIGCFVVKQFMEEMDPFKDQLACEECRPWKFFRNLFA